MSSKKSAAPAEELAPVVKLHEFITTTVAELGYELPIGVGDESAFDRSFAFGNWTAKEEKEIGKIRADNKNKGVGWFVCEVLAFFLREWPYDTGWAGKTQVQRHAVLSRSYAADVYHAWTMLRVENLGPDYPMGITCPNCDHEFVYTIDLNSLDVVKRAGGDVSLRRPVQLRKGITLKEKTRKLVTIEPPRWFCYEGMGELGGNTGAVKIRLVAGSVVAVEGIDADMHLPEHVIETLNKWDLELLIDEISAENQPGPNFQLDLRCPRCRMQMRETVQWIYDVFFSVMSSRASPT